MLDHGCPNIRELGAVLADVEDDLHISDQASATPTAWHPARIAGMLVETFVEVSALWLDLHTSHVCLWCQRDWSSPKLQSALTVNARLHLVGP